MDRNCPWTVAQETILLSYIPSEWNLLHAFSTLLKRGALTGSESKILHTQLPWVTGAQPARIAPPLRPLCYRIVSNPGPLSNLTCRRKWPTLFHLHPSPPFHTAGQADKKAPDAPWFGTSRTFGSHNLCTMHKETLTPNHKGTPSQTLSLSFSCHFWTCLGTYPAVPQQFHYMSNKPFRTLSVHVWHYYST